jgi:prepilin-type N-terminal cleavage/methylation domain-containing protein
MKQRGFTLIEILTVIAVLGILLVLLWDAYLKTMDAQRTGEIRLEYVQKSMRFIEELTREFQRLASDRPAKFSRNGADFTTRRENSFMHTTISTESPTIIRISVFDGSGKKIESQDVQFAGTIQLAYWSGAAWLDTWNEADLPQAISVRVLPELKRHVAFEPLEVAFNIGGVR